MNLVRNASNILDKILSRRSGAFRRVAASFYHSDEGVYGHAPDKKTRNLELDVASIQNRIQHSNLYRLVTAYREHGHQKASLDPLGLRVPRTLPELDPSHYGLDAGNNVELQGIMNMGKSTAKVEEVLSALEQTYCGPIGVEFQHLQTLEEREWFAGRFETLREEVIPDSHKVSLAKLMLKSQAFDHFLANKFTTVKRYGGEGAESMLVFIDELLSMSAGHDIKDVIMCIAHRGRLNLMTCLLNYPPVLMYRKMKGLPEFHPDAKFTGDVLSHLYSSVDLQYEKGEVHVSLLPNPSHLEAVNPVAVGKTRAKMQRKGDADYGGEGEVGDSALNLQIHGDAAFAAQGIVPETFMLANVPHFRVGGSLHLITNNQIGFTTESVRGRSSNYASDVGKMTDCPVIHVNGDHPEEVVRSCRLAVEYRQKFRKDVIIDYVCYRRWGHNELDDPSFTQPIMYEAIRNRKSIPDSYADKVVEAGLCSAEELKQTVTEWNQELNRNMEQIETHVPEAFHLKKQWSGYVQPSSSISTWETGVPVDLLKYIAAKSVEVPSEMEVHPTLKKTHCDRRVQRIEQGAQLDWATAEALAVGSLLIQDYNVRICGQDVGRGTFSHRHWMLVDQKSDHMHLPLNHISSEQQGFLEVCNSILSEEAVLGFEIGMSFESPKNLVIWEAQFGDFFNGAQIMVDTFVTSAETKWLLQSGLVMLLPHGFDGAGPEHTSCKIERFLQASDSKEDGIDGDDVNFQFANPTTAAQYFHLLRRQMMRNYRKPLVVASPKMILRLPEAFSPLSDMAPGTSFRPVLTDSHVDPKKVTKVIFCSGKHYYTLYNQREAVGAHNTAIIRLEELCPFPAEQIQKELAKYTNAQEFVWNQEEHQNMGAWTFIRPRFENLVGCRLSYVGRKVLGTTAVGVGQIHKQEAQEILEKSFALSS